MSVRAELVEALPFLPVRHAEEGQCFDFAQHERNFWRAEREPMIDNFSLALTHGLMALAAWYLLKRPDLDHEPSPRDQPAKPKGRWGRRDA